jgi:hypothetical protein
MWFCSSARSCAELIEPFATPVVSQSGSWLCPVSVWPRISCRFACAKLTISSAWDQS